MGKQGILSISNCCRSPMKVVSSSKYSRYAGEGATNYYKCIKCGKVCDGSVSIKMRTECEICGEGNKLCLLHNEIWSCKKCFISNGKEVGKSLKEIVEEWMGRNRKKIND